MQEIRFSQPAPQIPEVAPEKAPIKKKSASTGLLSVFGLIFKILLILAILYGGLIGSKYFLKSDERKDNYVAVFLINGQVYFGKFDQKNRDEIVMKEVYYLQNASSDLATSGELQKTGFTLVKLGQELHGPEDLMYINKSQVLFYEYLRADSQLVQTIQNYKK